MTEPLLVVYCEYRGAGHYLAYNTASEKTETERKIYNERRKRTSIKEVRHTLNEKMEEIICFLELQLQMDTQKQSALQPLGNTDCFLKADDLRKAATVY